MPTTLETTARGLFTHPNRLKLPPGAQLVAENCVFNREGITSRRRGFARYGDVLTTGPTELFKFNGRIVVADGTTLRYDSDGAGTWSPWTGTFSPPAAGIRMRYLEAEKSFLFTTDKGIFVNDALTGTPIRAGMPRGLDTQLSTTGTGGGWFLPDNQVGYRITWRRKDANGRIVQGSPSFQERLTNSFATELAWSNVSTTVSVTHTAHGFSNGDTIAISEAVGAGGSPEANIPAGDFVISNVSANAYDFTTSVAPTTGPGTLTDGKAYDVSLTFTVPDDVAAGHEYEIFRTTLSADDAQLPGEEHRLIITAELSSAEKSAGTVTVTDDNLEDFFTANLYTNPSQETEDLANDRPPLARFLVQFESHVFYFHVTYPHRLDLQILDLAGLVTGTSAITIDDGTTTETYTFETAENLGAKEFQLYTTFATAVQNIEATAKSLQKIINRGSAAWIAHYTSGVDEAPGILTLEARELDQAAFSIIADSSGTGDNFRPELPTSGTTVESVADTRQNGYVRSKSSQPEHVPETTGSSLGSGSHAILGAVRLPEAVIAFGEGGIFVIGGESDLLAGDLFREDDIDPTVILKAPESLITLDNAAAGYTNQGMLAHSGGQPNVLSRPQVHEDLRAIAELSAFSSAFGISYETENSLIFFVPENSADTAAEIAYVYNYSTLAWSTWRKPCQSGIVLDSDDKLYLGHNTDKFVLQERKSRNRGTREDYTDEDIPINIDTVSTTVNDDGDTVSLLTVTYSYTGKAMAAGFIVEQSGSRTYVEGVVDNGSNSYDLTMRRLVTGFTTGAATVGLPIDMIVEWIEARKNPYSLKRWTHCAVYPEDDGGTHQLKFHSDMQSTFESVDQIRISKSKGWGSVKWSPTPWGSSNPGKQSPVATDLPRNHQYGRTMTVRYENHYARESVDLLALALLVGEVDERSQREPR